MANNIVTPTLITKETLRIALNKSAFLSTISRKFEDQFRKSEYKPGDTVFVRKANQFQGRTGPVANIQDVNEATVPITFQPEVGVDWAFSDYDLALKIDDFSERYLEPAGKKLASIIDRTIAGMFNNSISNSVGTPGTPPTTNQGWQNLLLSAATKLADNGVPLDEDKIMVMDPRANQAVVSNLNVGFNDQRTIGNQYKTGMMDMALGWDFAMSQNVAGFTTGPGGGTPLVNGANQGITNTGSTDNPRANTTSLITAGWTAAAAKRISQGDVITLAGVFDVNADSKVALPNLKQFVATADASSDGSGNLTVIISPAIIAGGAYQNVTARPADNAALTINGGATASTAYSQSIGYNKDAFTFVTAPMMLPKGMDMAEQATYDGLTVRFVRGYDIVNNRRICRFDVLCGYGAVQPEWAVRMYTS